jgi:phosphatidylinositol 4-kinase
VCIVKDRNAYVLKLPIYVQSKARVTTKGTFQLLRLLCWSPAHIFTSEVMETGVYVWTWLFAATPHLSSLVLAELVDAWLWTMESRRGLFSAGICTSGPVMQLRPQLTPGEPLPCPAEDPMEGITAHRLWLGFFLDRFEVGGAQ